MKKEYIIRNDLAILNKKLKLNTFSIIDDVVIKKYNNNNYDFTNIIFDKEKKLNKIIIKELKFYLKKYNLNNSKSCLVVGLGNENNINDKIGVEIINYVRATGYIEKLNINSNYRKVYTFIPRTMINSGIEPYLSIKALAKNLNIDFIIICDALISSSIKYLNKVIQITDIGITPGSGIGNYQKEISINTLGIPVIIIGIPTAIEASTIIRDALNTKVTKIAFKSGYDFIVSTKDIQEAVTKLSIIIGTSINKSLNSLLQD